MKEITMYQTRDGSRFESKVAAASHEQRLNEVDAAESPLGPKWQDEDCKFANGHGYIQHSATAVSGVRAHLKRITNNAHPRVLDDGGDPAYRLFQRLACIDETNREWGQPYFALHPDVGDQKCLQDRSV